MIARGETITRHNSSLTIDDGLPSERGLAYSSIDEVRVVESGQIPGMDIPADGARLVVASPNLALHIDYEDAPRAYGMQASIIAIMNERRCFTREQMQRGMHWQGVR